MKARIEKGSIVIRLPIKNLKMAVEGYVDMDFSNLPMIITDAKAFAQGVVYALNREDEEGTTPVHLLFDQAFEHALEDGSEGVIPAIRCEDCCKILKKEQAKLQEGVYLCKTCLKEWNGE